MKKRIAVALILVVAAVAVVGAQNWQLAPSYGNVNLSAGFLPDPHTVNLTAGGSVNISGLGIGAFGYVANAPDVRLNYEAGSFSLTIRANSGGDTTILINAPDGSWYFNDDTNGLNPSYTFRNPMSGQYDIWVGTLGTDFVSARLEITEMGN